MYIDSLISPKGPRPTPAPVQYVSRMHFPVLNDRSILTNHTNHSAQVEKEKTGLHFHSHVYILPGAELN